MNQVVSKGPGLTLAIALLASAAAADEFAGYEFQLNGSAAIAAGHLRLTNCCDTIQVGTAFVADPFPIDDSTSFAASFSFEMVENEGVIGADGLAFVLHSDPAGAAAEGQLGEWMGYGGEEDGPFTGIANSMAIEFDCWWNAAWDPTPPPGDPAVDETDHVGYDEQGSAGSLQTALTAPLELNGGETLHAWVDYDGATNTLDVYLADTPAKPAAPLMTRSGVALPGLLGPHAYVGFTAATGTNAQIHDIVDFQIEFSGGPECLLVIGDGPGASSYFGLGHVFETQVDAVLENHPVSLAQVPEFVLPVLPRGSQVATTALAHQASSAPALPEGVPAWMADGGFAVQVLMWNPQAFPGQPEQHTAGLFVRLRADGGVHVTPYGDDLGGLQLWHEVGKDKDGQTVIRFPFSIPGF